MKLNRKGFMMAEVVVVSVIICTVLVTLYTALVRINNDLTIDKQVASKITFSKSGKKATIKLFNICVTNITMT